MGAILMAKKAKNVQTSDNQMDLFGLIEQSEWDDLKEQHQEVSLHDLVLGDVVRFKSYGGNTLEGVFVTKGFWDGRDRKHPEHFYFDVDGRFYEIGYRQDYVKIGHDASYAPPSKEDMKDRLVALIKDVPFNKRLETYQYSFRKNYPDVSYEYSPHISNAWSQAIVEVTTEEEVLQNKVHWSYISKLPKYVVEYIRNHVFPLSGVERLNALFQMRWVDVSKDYSSGGFYYFTRYLPERQITYYKELLIHLIENTSSPETLAYLARIWGPQSYGGIQKAIPGLFYLDNSEGEIKIIVSFDNPEASIVEDEEEPDVYDDEIEELVDELLDDEDEYLDEIA